MGTVETIISDRESRLVRKIAKEVYMTFCPAGKSGSLFRDDLYHYGIIGLLEAKRSFNPDRKVPWLVFAAYRVKGAMIDQIRREPMVKLPQLVQKKVKILQDTRDAMLKEGQPVDVKTLAERLTWPVEEILKVENLSIQIVPTNPNNQNDENDGIHPGKELVDPHPNPEIAVIKKAIAVSVRYCLDKLSSPEDRLIILGRILEGLKLREIGESLGVSAERVRQRQVKIQNEMKQCMQRQGWSHEETESVAD
ncbi:sigma-70 family RNA polymerase sigma factor [Desulfosarcina ovata]|nr:sigma-70 family RNA polymerase sigma factor [Desulfosarcina ovata]